MPRVSVVIPTFGRPALLRRAVDSVLSQTMADFELIVVIDGRDPETEAALAAVTDPRLRAIVQEDKRGAAHARDAGAGAARSEWIAFLDDDDLWLPEKLERQLQLAEAGPAVVTTLCSVKTFEKVAVRPQTPFRGDVAIDEWLFGRLTWLGGGGFVQCSCIMVPASLFARVRFRDMTQHDDWEFVLRAVKEAGLPYLTVPEPLVVHHFEEGRPSLQTTLTWRRSIEWADRLGPLLTRTAYAGFMLTVVARSAAGVGQYGALLPLLRAAVRRGRPTAKQLFAFALIWALPHGLRRRLRPSLPPAAQG